MRPFVLRLAVLSPLLAAVAPAGAAGPPALTKEPVYEGKRLSEWVAALRSMDADERTNAVTALAKIGAPAARPVAAALKDNSAVVRRLAAITLQDMGQRAKPVAPALAAAAGGPEAKVRSAVLFSLAKIPGVEKDILTILLAALTDRDVGARHCAALWLSADVRRIAAVSLGLGGGAKGAVRPLMRALKDARAEVRAAAASALGQAGPAAKPAVAALAGALKDDEVQVREAAADALDALGPDARSAAAALTEALKDGDPGVRARAVTALKKLTPEEPAGPASRWSGAGPVGRCHRQKPRRRSRPHRPARRGGETVSGSQRPVPRGLICRWG